MSAATMAEKKAVGKAARMVVLSVDGMVVKLAAKMIVCLSDSSKAQSPEMAVDTVYSLDLSYSKRPGRSIDCCQCMDRHSWKRSSQSDT